MVTTALAKFNEICRRRSDPKRFYEPDALPVIQPSTEGLEKLT